MKKILCDKDGKFQTEKEAEKKLDSIKNILND
jgi:hypothetical protein